MARKSYGFMEDCIHLKACRRVQKIAKGKYTGLCIPRNCDSDCTAYVSGKSGAFVTEDEALMVAWRQYDGDRDERDVFAHGDFPTKSIGEIINELEEKE